MGSEKIVKGTKQTKCISMNKAKIELTFDSIPTIREARLMWEL